MVFLPAAALGGFGFADHGRYTLPSVPNAAP